jgi:hypothetical protein
VSAPVAIFEAVRLVLAMATHQNWEVHHLDVKFAFLNGELGEEVFVRSSREEHVLKLKKVLYGLHQEPKDWNQKLDESLIALGFQRCPSDPAIYYRGNKCGDRLVLGVYVDDLVIIGPRKKEIQKFKKEMEK